jgi:uncharacterized protein YjiS (DUF1127 family)
MHRLPNAMRADPGRPRHRGSLLGQSPNSATALSLLDDRMLRDIGLTRFEADRLVRLGRRG